MRRLGIGIILALLMATSAHAGFRLRVDATQPAAVMEALRAQDASPATLDRLAALPGTVSGVEHHAQFTAGISMDTWRASLADAIAGRPRTDPYRFGSLVTNAPAIQANLDQIAGDPEAFSDEINAIVAPYTPAGLSFDATVVFVVGSSGNGWTRRAGEFFFDIGGAQGDLEGAKVISAHELYHLVLAHVMPDPTLPETDPLGRVERMLLNGINEGMASHVGRFRSDTGVLSRRNLGFEQINMRRLTANFRLLDVFLLATFHDPEITPRDAGVIVFSGSFNEPGYFAFREMAGEIERVRGREALVALLSQPPSRLVLEYHALAGSDKPRLSAATLEVIRRLDAIAPAGA